MANRISDALTVKNETTDNANTADRIGSLFEGLAKDTISVDTLAGLRGITDTLSDGDEVLMKGVVSPWDGGEGVFRWNASSTETDNDGLVVKRTDTATGRFERQNSDNIGRIEWFVGSDLTDHVANYSAIIELSLAGYKIKLFDTYSIDTGGDNTHQLNGGIYIYGEDPDDHGLIFEQPLSNNGSSDDYAYFREAGVDYKFKNISLITRDYLDGAPYELENFEIDNVYKLITVGAGLQSATGESDYVIEDCVIKGMFRAKWKFDATVRYYSCRRNEMFKITNIGPDNTMGDPDIIDSAYGVFANNKVRDCIGCLVWTPILGNAKFYALNNDIKNTAVYNKTAAYFSPFMLRGAGMAYIRGNTVEDWLSSDTTSGSTDASAEQGSECAFFDGYNVYMTNNTVKNLLSHRASNGGNSLIHWKSEGFGYVAGNEFIVDKESLYDIGVLGTLTAVTGESVGTGDGTTRRFKVASPPIDPDSETIYTDGTSTTDYIIDYDKGRITFDTAPADSVSITADYTPREDYDAITTDDLHTPGIFQAPQTNNESLTYINNVVKIPFTNFPSSMSWMKGVDFNNNYIEIDYIGDTSLAGFENEGREFLALENAGGQNYNGEYINVIGNTFKVNTVKPGVRNVELFGRPIVNQDNHVVFHGAINISDNDIYIPVADINMGGYNADKLIANNNICYSADSTINLNNTRLITGGPINDMQGTNTVKDPAIAILNYLGVPGQTGLIIQENTQNLLTVFETSLAVWQGFDDMSVDASNPWILSYFITFRDVNQQEFTVKFNLAAYDGSNMQYRNTSGNTASFDMRNDNNAEVEVRNKDNVTTDLSLFLRRDTNRNGYIEFRGHQDITEITIQTIAKLKTGVDSGTFYDSFL